nr:protein trapped in endoderm-1-like [Bactrocera oleae]
MITINRYIMIAHHASYAKIYKKHWIAIMIIFWWASSYGMQIPTLLGVWGTFDYDAKSETCSIMNAMASKINEQSVDAESLENHITGENSYKKQVNNSSRTATHATRSSIGQPFVAFHIKSPEQEAPPNTHGKRRHHFGGR